MGLEWGNSNQMSLGHCTVPVVVTLDWPSPAAAGRGGEEEGGVKDYSKAIAQPLGPSLG